MDIRVSVCARVYVNMSEYVCVGRYRRLYLGKGLPIEYIRFPQASNPNTLKEILQSFNRTSPDFNYLRHDSIDRLNNTRRTDILHVTDGRKLDN